MSFDFPNAPVEGDTYQPPSGQQFAYMGGMWRTQGAATEDAPIDDGEYTRVNGVWRLKSQTFDITGKTLLDVPVPAWPTQVRLTILVYSAAAQTGIRISGDGTTFDAGTVYTMGGFYHNTGTAAFVNYSTTHTSWLMASTSDNVNIAQCSDAIVTLTRSAAGYVSYRVRGGAYIGAQPTNLYVTYMFNGYSQAGGAGSGRVKAIRYFGTSGIFERGKIVAEWLQ